MMTHRTTDDGTRNMLVRAHIAARAQRFEGALSIDDANTALAVAVGAQERCAALVALARAALAELVRARARNLLRDGQ